MNDKVISIQLTMDDREFTVSTKRLGSLLNALQRDLQTTATAANRVEARMGGLGTAFRHVVMTAAAVRFALMDVNDLFLSLPRSIIKTTGEFERLSTLLKGMSRSTDEVGRLADATRDLNYVIDLSKNAPFNINSLSDSFVKLKSAGIDPTKGAMSALVDSVARFGGDSDTLKRASIAIQQMAGKGVISMEELRQQLGEAVPDAMQSMAKGMGLTMAELSDLISKGTVQSTDALNRMFTVMRLSSGGSAKDLMSTWGGITSRMKTEWEMLQKTAGEAGFMESVKQQAKDISQFLGTTQGKQFAAGIGEDLASVVRAMRTLVDLTIEYGSVVKTAATAMATFWAVGKVNAYRAAVMATFRESQRGFIQSVQERRSEAAAAAGIEMTKAQGAIVANTARIENEKATYRRLKSLRTEYVAQIAQIEADTQRRLLTSRNPKYDRNIMSNDVQVDAIRAQLVANDALLAKQREVNTALIKERGEVQKTAAEKAKLSVNTLKASQSIGVMTRALGATQFVFNALGGWLGLVTLALTIGATMWDKWGNKGAEAIEKVRNQVNQGLSTKDTVKTLKERQGQVDTEIAKLDSQITLGQSLAPITYNAEGNLAKLRAERQKLVDEQAALPGQIAKATKNSIDNSAKEQVTAWNDATASELQAIQKNYNAKRTELEKTAELAMQQEKAGSAKRKALEKKLATDRKKLYQEQTREAFEAAKQREAQAQKSLDVVRNEAGKGSTDPDYNYRLGAAKAVYDAAASQRNEAKDLLESATSLDKPLDLGNPKKPASKKDPRDAITKAIDRAQSKLDKAMIRLDDLNDGVITYQRLYDSALAGLEADRDNGNLKGSDAELKELATSKAQKEALDRLAKSLISLNREEEKVKSTRAEIIARYDDPFNAERATTGVFELEQSLRVLGNTLTETDRKSAEFRNKAASLISKQAINDYLTFVEQLREKTKDLTIELLPYENDRQAATQRRELEELDRAHAVRKAALSQEVKDREDANAVLAKAEADYQAYRTKLIAKQQLQARPLLVQTLHDWTDVYGQMNQVTASWAQQGMDMWVNFATTGKMEWRNLLATMLTDATRFTSQVGFGALFKGMAGGEVTGKGGFSEFLGAAASKVGGWFGVSEAPAPVSGATGAAGLGAQSTVVGGSLLSGGADAVGGTAVKALAGAGESAKVLTDSFSSLGKDTIGVSSSFLANTLATGDMTSAIGANTASTVVGMLTGQTADTVEQTAAMSLAVEMGLLSVASQLATGALISMAAAAQTGAIVSAVPHANGGIFGAKGSVQLSKYARGGIAKSPQLALFGEGSMAEAYVPLPDGRSIPVTMQGDMGGSVAGGGNVVTISINVNENGQASAQTSGNGKEGWTQMANQIVGLIDDRINHATRNGGALSKKR